MDKENKAESFSYDPVGNRLSGPEAKESYSYNIGNQLTDDRKHAYDYDRNGNLVGKDERGDDGKNKTWTYSYDFENRLAKVVKKEDRESKTITFKYDPFGRRVEKRVKEAKDGKTESKTYTYVYDNEDIILEYLVKEENGKKSKTEVTRYVHGPGIDEPLAIERKGEIYFYHVDGLGSITALTDERQKVVESYSYSSFGELKRKGDRVKNAYTYTAREWDEEIGLYYYRARYYDAEVGRFISKDPIGFEGGVNHFVYVFGNPINSVDPLGLQAGLLTAGWGIALTEPTPIGEIIMTGVSIGVLTLEIYKQCKDSPCPPCNPPKGTIGYRLDLGHSHYPIDGAHVHLFKMNQNPNNCQCFWQPIGVTAPPPPAGAIPLP